jgi:guanylate kinase
MPTDEPTDDQPPAGAEMTREEFLKVLPGLVKDYQALPETLERISNIDLLMIVGGTGVGKTSIIKRLGIPYVITDTTRPIRPDEINGSDYFFRTDYAQLAAEIKDRKFVQVNVFPTGDFYGTRASAYPELGLAVYAVVSDKIAEFRELGFNETTTAFITPPTFLEWMGRLDKYNVERNQLAKRLEEAKRSFYFAINDAQTHFILNENLDKAVDQAKMLLVGTPDKDRENTAREAAKKIYEELSFT